MKIRFCFILLCFSAVGLIAQTTSYQYDNLNRIIRVEYSSGLMIQYTYDAVGNRTGHIVSPPAVQNPPAVIINGATNITANSAQLNGTVNPNGANTTYYFEYGTSTSYGSNTPSQSAGSGTNNVTVNRIINGLTPNTTYHFRLTATNSGGTSNGSDLTFTTLQLLSPPTNVSATDGTFADRVQVTWNASSGATHYRVFRNSTDNSASAQALSNWQSLRTYNDINAISGTTYYYWVKAATNNLGANESGFSNSDAGYRVTNLTVTPPNQDVENTAGSADFSINSNTNWNANDDASWLTLNQTAGNNDFTLKANYTTNSLQNTRVATITVTGSGVTRQVTVTQAGALYLTVTPPNQDVNNNSGNITFNITSNTSWNASDNANWLTLDKTSGNNNATLTANYDANSESNSRTAIITVAGAGINRQVTVTQAGESFLTVTPSNRDVDNNQGNTTFSINSNTSWTANDDATWLTLSQSSGSNDATLTANYGANSSSDTRTATISISGAGITREVTVTQTGSAFITITQPNSNSNWVAGLSYNIQWNSNNAGTSVQIRLYKGTNFQETIISNTNNDGNYEWIVPNNLSPANDYQIRVSSASVASADGYSDNFTISQQNSNWSFFQQISVPSEGNTIYTNTLRNDRKYRLTVNGTYYYWYPSQPNSIADAEWAETTPMGNPGWTNPPNSLFELLVDGQDIDWGNYNANHEYQYELNGKGASISLKIYDTNGEDNQGSLSVLIEESNSTNEFIEVISPTNISNWKKGSSHIIQWNSNITSAVSIRLYRGSNLEQTIESSTLNDGSYNWQIPFNITATSNYRIRISSTTNASIEGYSDYFSISEPTGDDCTFYDQFIVSSNGQSVQSKVLNSGTQYTITAEGTYSYWYPAQPTAIADAEWAETSATGIPGWTNPPNSDLELMVNEQDINWGDFNSNHTYTYQITGAGNSISFRLNDSYTLDNSGSLTVTIEECSGGTGAITVNEPNSNSDWQKGRSYTIQWSSSGNTGSDVQIRLYKGNSLQQTISSNISNDGTHTWAVPTNIAAAGDYRIRVTSTSVPSADDYSDNFAISEVPTIVVTKPNVNSTWQKGGTYTVQWISSGNAGGEVQIRLYRGTSFQQTIISNTDNDGNYQWTIPANIAAGSDYKIRINSSTVASADGYSNNFVISEQPKIVITEPDVNSEWQKGSSHTIQWSSSGNTGSDVQIRLYKGNSLQQTIASSISNDGTHTWTIPINIAAANDYRIRVTSTSAPSANDYSDYFAISEQPTIVVLKPNVNDTWQKGLTYPIQWSTLGNTGNEVQIRLYRGDSFEQTIISNTNNNGNHNWTVPSNLISANDYRIRVTSTTAASADDYSDNFDITDQPSISVTEPHLNSNWEKDNQYVIQWLSSGDTGNDVQIRLYMADNFQQTIVASTNNDGSYTWLVPNNLVSANDYKIRITSATASSADQYSDNFEISDKPVITLTEPHANNDWQKGRAYTIQWSSLGNTGSDVQIRLYRGNSFQLTIVSSTNNNGNYVWEIPTNIISANDYRIRVTSTTVASADGYSDEFSIADEPVIMVTEPNSNSNWLKGKTYTVQWLSSGQTGSEVKIRLFRNSILQQTIVENIANDGSYDWLIPNDIDADNNYSIEVHSTSLDSTYDFSESFVISNTTAEITFSVTIPPDSPENAQVFLTGTFNGWDPGPAESGSNGEDDLPMMKISDNNFQLTRLFNIGEMVEYKYTLGSWETVEQDNFGNDIPNRILLIPDGNQTQIDTVKKWLEIPTSVSLFSRNLPTEYALEQNYPNPFNPVTTIRFKVPKQSQVSIKIVSILGKEITTLISKEMRPGEYNIVWDASNFSSGIYLYQMRTEGYVITRKLVFHK